MTGRSRLWLPLQPRCRGTQVRNVVSCLPPRLHRAQLLPPQLEAHAIQLLVPAGACWAPAHPAWRPTAWQNARQRELGSTTSVGITPRSTHQQDNSQWAEARTPCDQHYSFPIIPPGFPRGQNGQHGTPWASWNSCQRGKETKETPCTHHGTCANTCNSMSLQLLSHGEASS